MIITNTSQPSDQRKVNHFDASIVESDIDQLGLSNVEQLAALFFESVDGLKTELIEAMAQNNFDKLEKLAHRMNGAAGNFGLLGLCALSARIETQASEGVKPADALQKQFIFEYDESISMLSAYLLERKELPKKASVSR